MDHSFHLCFSSQEGSNHITGQFYISVVYVTLYMWVPFINDYGRLVFMLLQCLSCWTFPMISVAAQVSLHLTLWPLFYHTVSFNKCPAHITWRLTSFPIKIKWDTKTAFCQVLVQLLPVSGHVSHPSSQYKAATPCEPRVLLSVPAALIHVGLLLSLIHQPPMKYGHVAMWDPLWGVSGVPRLNSCSFSLWQLAWKRYKAINIIYASI